MCGIEVCETIWGRLLILIHTICRQIYLYMLEPVYKYGRTRYAGRCVDQPYNFYFLCESCELDGQGIEHL